MSLAACLIHLVALTQTAKKTRDHKSSFIAEVRAAIDEHSTLYLFSYENMRSTKFKKIRQHFSSSHDAATVSSRIFLGKNKLMQIALGKTPEDEYADNLRHVAKLTSGSVGLLVTSMPQQEVEDYFENLVEPDFARAGCKASQTVAVTNEMLSTHPVSMVEQFRKLGLPVEVNNGRLVLVGGRTEFTLCQKDTTILSAEKCKLLVSFGIMLADFSVALLCRWTKDGGEFEVLRDAN